MHIIVLIVCFLGIIVHSNGQIAHCPSGWILNSKNCYYFAEDQFFVYEEADAACWRTGARLLSVNNYQEHKFVSDWLLKNNIQQTKWFTSGIIDSPGTWTPPIVFWGDNTITQDQNAMLWRAPAPSHDAKGHRVIYVYTSSQYLWTNAMESQPGNFICEIPLKDVGNTEIIDRDFAFGMGKLDIEEIEKGPKIIDQPMGVIILTGATHLVMECAATSNPFPQYTWYNKDGELTSTTDTRYTLSGGRFTIQNPTREDVGEYFCKAANSKGSIFSNDAKMIYGSLEQFSNIEPQPTTVTAFKGTTMDCNKQADPSTEYQWFKNKATNIFIYENNDNIFVSHSGLLYVSSVQNTDFDKRYFCVASLVAPTGYEMAEAEVPSVVNLGIELKSDGQGTTDNDYGPEIHTHSFPSPALVGSKVRIECVAYGKLPLKYYWSRKDGRPFVENTVFKAINRVMEIKNAPLSAEGDYVCTCTRGGGARASKTVSLRMEAKPYFPYPLRDMLVDNAMTVKWYCKAVARPSATYAWFKNGVQLQSTERIQVKSNELTILNVDEKLHEGMYQCSATNTHGTTYSTGELKVLSFEPNFKRFPLSYKTPAALGGNITIACQVEAAPVPDVRWLKGGGDMGLSPQQDAAGSRVWMDEKYTLHIADVNFGDAGLYRCEATNILGSASNQTEVTVITGITIMRGPARADARVNTTTFIPCVASFGRDRYDLAYVWEFNGRQIDPELNKEYVFAQKSGVDGLYIQMTQYKHQGLYTCVAKTPLHSTEQSGYLTVEGPPGPPAGLYADDQSVTTESVRLVWTVTPFMDHGDPINMYDIEAETNYYPNVWRSVATDISESHTKNEAQNHFKRDEQRAVVVKGLIPNTSYRFRVRAINTFGRGKEASRPSASVKLRERTPIIAPRNVGGGGGKVGTLTVSWEPLDVSEYCGPGLGYLIYWKKIDDKKDWKEETVTDKHAGSFTVTVGVDNYYLEYIVKVGTFNDLGAGSVSPVKTIFSAMGMPNSVPLIEDSETFNSTSILVRWKPVADDRDNIKGRVKGYRIHYFKDNDFFDTKSEPDPVTHEIRVKDIYGQTDHAQLIGLDPYSTYYARVQVFNDAGTGPKGEWRWAETANRPLSRFPTHIQVYPRDRHSVEVEWRGLSIIPEEESLESYVIRVWKVQEDVRTAKDYRTYGKETRWVVDGLQSNTVYTLRVLGHSRAGDGAISEAVYFSVASDSIVIPFDPATTTFCFMSDTGHTCGSVAFRLDVLLLVLAMFTTVLQRYT